MKESLLIETMTMAKQVWPTGDVGVYCTYATPSQGAPRFTCKVLQDGNVVETVTDGPLVENAINAMWNTLKYSHLGG